MTLCRNGSGAAAYVVESSIFSQDSANMSFSLSMGNGLTLPIRPRQSLQAFAQDVCSWMSRSQTRARLSVERVTSSVCGRKALKAFQVSICNALISAIGRGSQWLQSLSALTTMQRWQQQFLTCRFLVLVVGCCLLQVTAKPRSHLFQLKHLSMRARRCMDPCSSLVQNLADGGVELRRGYIERRTVRLAIHGRVSDFVWAASACDALALDRNLRL